MNSRKVCKIIFFLETEVCKEMALELEVFLQYVAKTKLI
jgi:hypothetical protein